MAILVRLKGALPSIWVMARRAADERSDRFKSSGVDAGAAQAASA